MDYLLRIFIVFIAFAVNSFTRLAPWTKCKFIFKCAECAKFMGRRRINFIPGSTCYPTLTSTAFPSLTSALCAVLSLSGCLLLKNLLAFAVPNETCSRSKGLWPTCVHTHVWAYRVWAGQASSSHWSKCQSAWKEIRVNWQRVIPTCCPVNLIELRFTFHTFYAGFFITLLLLLLLL